MAGKKEDNRDVFEKALEDNARQRDELKQRRKYYMVKYHPEKVDEKDRSAANLLGGLVGLPIGTAVGLAVAGRLKKRPNNILSDDYANYSRAQMAGLIGGGTAGAIGGSELLYAEIKNENRKFMDKYERKRRKE